MKNLLVVGVGGAGAQIARQFGNLLGWPTLAVNTDSVGLKKSALDRQLLIGSSVCQGQAANTPVRGRLAAEESIQEIQAEFKPKTFLVLVAGLGGGVGTGAIPVIIDVAQSMGVKCFAALTLPFEHESGRRKIALDMLHELRSKEMTIFLHDHAGDMGGRNLLDAFHDAERKLAEAVNTRLLEFQNMG